MKKTLYSTTALVAAGVLSLGASNAFAQAVAPAAPEKMKLELGGFMNQYVGYVDQDKPGVATGNAYKHVDQKSDSEVYFTGSLKLDNGITVGVMVQLEADSTLAASSATPLATNQIDESYVRLTGDFGEFRLGNSDPGASAVSVSAPYVGINAYNTDQDQWIVNPTSGANTGSTTTGGTDASRIYYVSPSFAGFRIAGSYAPSLGQSETAPQTSEADQWDGAAQYAGKVGDVGFRVSASYWAVEGSTINASSSTRNVGVGADVTFADITFGGGFRDTNSKSPSVTAAVSQSDFRSWNVGAVYKPGPYSLGLTYQTSTGTGGATTVGDDKVQRWTLGATYSIGPGVDLMSNVLYHSYQDEGNVVSLENKGVAVIGGLMVSF